MNRTRLWSLNPAHRVHFCFSKHYTNCTFMIIVVKSRESSTRFWLFPLWTFSVGNFWSWLDVTSCVVNHKMYCISSIDNLLYEKQKNVKTASKHIPGTWALSIIICLYDKFDSRLCIRSQSFVIAHPHLHRKTYVCARVSMFSRDCEMLVLL